MVTARLISLVGAAHLNFHRLLGDHLISLPAPDAVSPNHLPRDYVLFCLSASSDGLSNRRSRWSARDRPYKHLLRPVMSLLHDNLQKGWGLRLSIEPCATCAALVYGHLSTFP